MRAGLWSGASLVAAAGLLHTAGAEWTRWEALAGGLGIGLVVATPFVTLLALAVRARRSALGLYAGATLVLALLGVLLAA